MGKRLNLSTPTVINTELIPLDESFYIESDGQLEQWFYDNTSQYAPDRSMTPLTLTPKISAYDADTRTTYSNISYSYVNWYVLEYNGSSYTETEITNIVDSANAEFVKMNNNSLKVKKNVLYSRSITIRCEAMYVDPRDIGITYKVQTSVLLVTNRDAEVRLPEVAITSPSARSFNPLTDYDSNNAPVSQFDFDATISNVPETDDMTEIAKYDCDGMGTEELIKTDTSSIPYITTRYPDGSTLVDEQYDYRQTAGGTKPNVSGAAVVTNLKGNTVKFNQLVTNGNFESGTWGTPSSSVTTRTVVGNTLIINASSTGYQGGCTRSTTIITGHKYLLSGYAYSNALNDNGISASIFMCQTSASLNATYIQSDTIINNYTSQKVLLRGIFTGDSTYQFVALKPRVVDTDTYFSCINLFDLTEIFGAGNEPSTAGDFETWLANNIGTQKYYAYDAGSLRPVTITGIKSIGFNQWDEEWEHGSRDTTTGEKTLEDRTNLLRCKNLIPVDSNKSYYFKYGGTYTNKRILYMNENGVPISSTTTFVNSVLNIPINCKYIAFQFSIQSGNINYQNDICINISDPNRNGTYLPYNENIAAIPITTLTGKLNGTGSSVTIFPNGMMAVNSVYDEIKIDNGVVKAIRRVGKFDITENTSWNYNSSQYRFTTSINVKSNTRILTSRTIPYQFSSNAYSTMPNMTYGTKSNSELSFKNNTATAEEFKSSLDRVTLFYELATPVEYVLDPTSAEFIFKWFGMVNGTEVSAETLPWYVSGQNTNKLRVDAMYGENINVVLRATKNRSSSELSPSKAFASVSWRVPDVDTHVVSKQGGAVRTSDNTNMVFDTICNVNGSVVPDAIKSAHLRFNWKYRHSNEITENDAGWGQTTNIAKSNLYHTKGSSSSLASTLVYPYVYVLGAWQVKTQANTSSTYSQPETTKDGVTYVRTID